MINLTIDTSVFMIPQKEENLKHFFSHIKKIYKLEKSSFVTVNYMNYIPNNLGFVKTIPSTNFIKKTIIDRKAIRSIFLKNNSYKEEIGFDHVKLKKIYIDKLDEIRPKGRYNKGKIGIYKNIPERNKEPCTDYRAINTAPDIYYDKDKTSIFLQTFKNYLGYLAYINSKYACEHKNYIVLGAEGGKGNLRTERITSAKDKSEALVNIIGIDKIFSVCTLKKEREFDSLVGVLNETKKSFQNQNNHIIFSSDVNQHNVTKKLNLTKDEAQKVYLYIKTLNEIIEIIKSKNICDETTTDDTIVELMNAHGLLCSPENEETMKYGYRKFNCKQRTLDDGIRGKILYDYHLKPLTNYKQTVNGLEPDAEHTVRIYIAWDSKLRKISIGWMGHHLPECGKDKDKITGKYTNSDCPDTNCKNNALYIINSP